MSKCSVCSCHCPGLLAPIDKVLNDQSSLLDLSLFAQERMEKPAEAASQGQEEKDNRRDRYQGQRVRGLLPEEGTVDGHLREGLGEAVAHPGGKHTDCDVWQVGSLAFSCDMFACVAAA